MIYFTVTSMGELTSKLFLNLETTIVFPSVTAQLSEQAFSSSLGKTSFTIIIVDLIVFLQKKN